MKAVSCAIIAPPSRVGWEGPSHNHFQDEAKNKKVVESATKRNNILKPFSGKGRGTLFISTFAQH